MEGDLTKKMVLVFSADSRLKWRATSPKYSSILFIPRVLLRFWKLWKLCDSDIDTTFPDSTTEPPSPSSTDTSIPDSTTGPPSPSSTIPDSTTEPATSTHGRRQSWDWSDDEFWGDDDFEDCFGSAWQNYLGDISVHVMEEEEGEVCLGRSIWQVWVRRARKHGKVRRHRGRRTKRKRRRKAGRTTRRKRRRRQERRRRRALRRGRVIKRRRHRACFRGGATRDSSGCTSRYISLPTPLDRLRIPF